MYKFWKFATLWADFLILVRHYGSASWCDIMGRFCDIMGQVRHYGSIATLWGSTAPFSCFLAICPWYNEIPMKYNISVLNTITRYTIDAMANKETSTCSYQLYNNTYSTWLSVTNQILINICRPTSVDPLRSSFTSPSQTQKNQPFF